jgi:outer membrane immunogenic protein
MKPIVVAILLSIVSAGGAAAADLELPAAAPPRVPANYYPTPFEWGGIYLGANGGYAAGRSNWANAGLTTGTFGATGALAGVTLGVNYAGIGGAFLVGLEGDIDWSTLKGSSSVAGCAAVIGPPPGPTCQTSSDWLSTERLRVGYTFNRLLIFGTAGAAIGDFKVSINPPLNFFNTSQLGWTAGAGVEYAFTDFLTAKVEYLYVNLGSLSCPSGGACGPVTAASVSLTENIVRGGLNFKFGW